MSGGIVRIGPDNIIAEMRNWHIEANSNHNDGYIREHFQNHLEEVYKAVDDMRMSKDIKKLKPKKLSGFVKCAERALSIQILNI